MNKFSQSGKGLSGFFFGLILATVIIAGILFYLNQSGQNAFKIPVPSKQPAETEILKPKNQPKEDIQPEPADQNALSEPDAATEAEQSDAEKAADKADEVEEKAGEPEREEPDGQAVRKKVLTEEREQTVGEKAQKKDAETVKKQAVKPSKETEKKASKEEKKAEKEKVAPKPTPEQILNSGSIEKARSAAAKEVQKMKTSDKAEATHYLQMGAYADRRSAEGQRAKLAILGISSKVVGYQAGHKTLYRVQSGNMSADAVKKMQDELKKHEVASLIRSIESK
ncbi:TPA: cell division protein FtsN [Neisseria meningitidis]|uniref:cell division protein FtsN n=1 Tax=Neisseria meningitidis TaxID=487 RepID=UPI000268746F|nr:cell division protein FtsN [Neisseria meningitidis]MDO6016812.1 cell division protein FtsN [Neisseria gonorrhoeae]CCI73286.1 Histone transcription regulator-like protein [Neisseria meningitidis alpha704]APY28771.1 cell division protein FtsN [Neisseria meningitidis]EJU77913.1 cell division protein FtsN [Neisseria meningitidis NM2795]EQD00720.1 cell division protein FtsN [Neisseria meningitidis NM3141]